MPTSSFPASALRAALARERVTGTALATASGITANHLYRLLAERRRPGPATVLRLQIGLRRVNVSVPEIEAIDALGLDGGTDE